jgi:hypothetical protein
LWVIKEEVFFLVLNYKKKNQRNLILSSFHSWHVLVSDQMKSKKYHTVGTFLNPNTKVVERCKIDWIEYRIILRLEIIGHSILPFSKI